MLSKFFIAIFGLLVASPMFFSLFAYLIGWESSNENIGWTLIWMQMLGFMGAALMLLITWVGRNSKK